MKTLTNDDGSPEFQRCLQAKSHARERKKQAALAVARSAEELARAAVQSFRVDEGTSLSFAFSAWSCYRYRMIPFLSVLL